MVGNVWSSYVGVSQKTEVPISVTGVKQVIMRTPRFFIARTSATHFAEQGKCTSNTHTIRLTHALCKSTMYNVCPLTLNSRPQAETMHLFVLPPLA
jgi:hypothetical protein